MLTTKYIKPTQKEYGHTKIFIDSEYIGYIMPDRLKGGYHFDGRGKLYPKTLHAKNRNAIIVAIIKEAKL